MDVKEGGAPIDESGATVDDEAQPDPKASGASDVVALEDHKRTLDDMHKYKRLAKEYESKLKEAQHKTLKEKEDFKTLYEQEREQREAYEQRYQGLQASLMDAERRAAVLRECERLGGLYDPSDIDLFDLSDVVVERTDQGRMIVHGADHKAQSMLKGKAHLFKKKDVPTFNSGGASKGEGVKSEVMTAEQLRELEKKVAKGDYKARLLYRQEYAKYLAHKRGT